MAVMEQLARTRPWVRFISILTFVGVGFMLLAALGMATVGLVGSGNSTRGTAIGAGMGLGMAAFYVVLAGLYIFPGIKLWKYANRIGDLTRSYQEFDLVAALSEQRSFWKFAGIAMIAMIILYIVVIIAAVGIGAFASSIR